MANKNKNSTRYYSDIQEDYVAKLLGGKKIPNSGAGLFNKSDVVVEDSSLSLECKTSTTEKQSFSIKREWFDKHSKEAFGNRLYNEALCFNFGPNTNNYFIINEKLMVYLTDKLKDDNQIN